MWTCNSSPENIVLNSQSLFLLNVCFLQKKKKREKKSNAHFHGSEFLSLKKIHIQIKLSSGFNIRGHKVRRGDQFAVLSFFFFGFIIWGSGILKAVLEKQTKKHLKSSS